MPPSGTIVYQQPWDGTANAYASQNDTGFFGNFAACYDNFTLSTGTTLTGAAWTGAYFNPPTQGPITAWNVLFLSDNAGQPGTSLSRAHIPGTANETFLGFVADQSGEQFPFYSYWTNVNFQVTAGTKYWFSVFPDLVFPPQWGWGQGTGGDSIAFEDFFGTRIQLTTDLAFTLYAGGGGPPPSSQSAFFKIQKLVVSVKQDNIPVRGRNK